MKKQSSTGKNTSRSRQGSNGRSSNGNGSSGTRSNSKAGGRARSTSTQNRQQDEQGVQPGTSPLEKLFLTMLKEMYYVEKRQVESLQDLHMEATTEELQDALEDHRFTSEKQASRIEKVFALLGMEPQEKQCTVIDAMITEAEEMLDMTEEGTMTRDVALIIAAQKVEHYEIAVYGSLVELALTLGDDKVAFILEKNLLEEEDTDQLLTDIAQCEVNPLADEDAIEVEAEYEEEVTA